MGKGSIVAFTYKRGAFVQQQGVKLKSKSPLRWSASVHLNNRGTLLPPSISSAQMTESPSYPDGHNSFVSATLS